MLNVLVISSDSLKRVGLKGHFRERGFSVAEKPDGLSALEFLATGKVHIILCDYHLNDMDGVALIARLKEMRREIPVILIAEKGNIREAVDAIKQGAFQYINSPVCPEMVTEFMFDACKITITSAGEQLTGPPDTGFPGAGRLVKIAENYIYGSSPVFQEIIRQISIVALTDFSIILYGESGSGKEIIARSIHNASSRSGMPFVAIDCGALSSELAGSELFGHERGAFTGAHTQKTGSFELANGGTLFLDEIANLSYEIQISLLRVIQEKKIRRVGGNKDIGIDVRIIVASNACLQEASRHGRFRKDLYHRFNEFRINVPPLRERKEDIPVFARFFLQKANVELKKHVTGFSAETEALLLSWSWPGNLREMKNVVRRGVLMADGPLVEKKDLPPDFSLQTGFLQGNAEQSSPLTGAMPVSFPNHPSGAFSRIHSGIKEAHDLRSAGLSAEKQLILEVLRKVNFNKSKAARLLDINRKTLYNKLKYDC